mgnify:FL=1|jgi:nucleotide-binding universal stress UspA family protein
MEPIFAPSSLPTVGFAFATGSRKAASPAATWYIAAGLVSASSDFGRISTEFVVRTSFLPLMSCGASAAEVEFRLEEVGEFVGDSPGEADLLAVGTESRGHTISKASPRADRLVMAGGDQARLQRAFFGSLAEDVALRLEQPMILVGAGIGGHDVPGLG